MRTIFKNILFSSNLIFAILLCFAWAGSFYFTKVIFFSFLALALPPLFIINLFFLLFWTFYTKSKKNVILSLIPVILCSFILNRFLKIGEKEQIQGDIAIMSYNIKEFTPYQNIYQKEDLYLFDKKYFALIEEENPDILCLQEFSDRGNELKSLYPYYILNLKLQHKASRPLIIFSKFPIINHYTKKIKGKYTNNLFADIVIQKDTVRVVNFHMESLTLKSTIIQDSTHSILTRYSNLYSRFAKSFQLHQEQVDVIMDEVKKSPYPVILCGDFNNTPFSYEYSKVTSFLHDTYRHKGTGIVDTYHNIPIPIRIDYIFTSPTIEINSYKVIDKKISDHYPVKVSLTFPK
ncbi:MAG: endonuclease/exonuclease/phosphatase family protein [Flavobacteriales bacterium]